MNFPNHVLILSLLTGDIVAKRVLRILLDRNMFAYSFQRRRCRLIFFMKTESKMELFIFIITIKQNQLLSFNRHGELLIRFHWTFASKMTASQ